MKYYDKSKNCIVFINEAATSNFWDNHWLKHKDSKLSNPSKKNFFIKNTIPYLKPDNGIILEGGCGNGNSVKILNHFKYNVIGLDYAKKTIEELQNRFPEINFVYGDVRNLRYEDSFFVGYWSVGVIEHFWHGYKDIAREMARVIKPGGYLFLTFPQMSILRRLKVKMGLYQIKESQDEPKNFYQFALDSGLVVKDFKKLGFVKIKSKPYSAVKGLKDECMFLKKPLQFVFEYKGKNIILKIVQKSLELSFSWFAGHSILLVLKKT